MLQKLLIAWIVAAAFSSAVAEEAMQGANASPVGTYLWLSGPEKPPSDADCGDLVERVKPSMEKAEMSLWGRLPENDPAAESFFLFLSETRMEPTYAAEGDYDFGDVELGATRNGITPFTIVPDDHRDMKLEGVITAEPGVGRLP